MAQKKPVAKKSVAKASSRPKTKTNRKISAKVLYTERHPEKHIVSGKFVFFYIFFACTTILFAVLTVWLFVFSSEVLNKYETITNNSSHITNCEEKTNSEEENQ